MLLSRDVFCARVFSPSPGVHAWVREDVEVFGPIHGAYDRLGRPRNEELSPLKGAKARRLKILFTQA